jgi:hypothetical protein
VVDEVIDMAGLAQACRVLFGPDIRVSRDFFLYMRADGVKAAYRRRARETHPDSPDPPGGRAGASGESFIRVNDAYRRLRDFVEGRASRRLPRPAPRPPEGARRSAPGEAMERRFAGPMPARPLEIGRFLYYRGLIPFRALILALAWQRGQRPALGRMARDLCWLSEADVGDIIRSPGGSALFGQRALERGYLSRGQLELLLYLQRSRQRRLGAYFVEKGFLSGSQMEALAAEQGIHNARTRFSSGRKTA